MKFKMHHDISKNTLTIPRAALQLSELADAEELILHMEPGCVLLARDDLTAAESLGVIRLLSDLAVSLLLQLKQASLAAAEMIDSEECGNCDCECCSGLTLPVDLLEQAGIGPDEALRVAAEDGKIVIAAAEDSQNDPLNELESHILFMLVETGIDLDGLRHLLRDEGKQDE